MTCDICERDTEGVLLVSCPQCGARYCPSCMNTAFMAGSVRGSDDLADYIWRHCCRCGVIRV